MMHIFVINLPRSTERRERIERRLAELGLTAEIFPATDGRALPDDGARYQRWKRLLFFGKDLTPGEIGCAYSHLAVYQAILDRGLSHALILEDDALLCDHLPQALSQIMRYQDYWDVMRFIHFAKAERLARRVADIGQGMRLSSPFGASGGAYGYVINAHAARRLIDAATPLWVPVDTLQGQTWRTGLRVLMLTPSPVQPDYDIESTIGNTRFDKTLSLPLWFRAVFTLSRPVYKFYELVMKRYGFWRQINAHKALSRIAAPQ